MIEAPVYFDVAFRCMPHSREEVCGDQVKLLRMPDRTLLALASAPGVGIEAAIPARLTTEIIITMLREAAPLEEVLDTLLGTMPRPRPVSGGWSSPAAPAAAPESLAFVAAQVRHATGHLQVVRLESPAPLFLRAGHLHPLPSQPTRIRGRTLFVSDLMVERGDFVGLMSNGFHRQAAMHLDRLSRCLKEAFRTRTEACEALVSAVLRESGLVELEAREDASFAGISARKARRLMLFSGPPLQPSQDAVCAQKFLAFPGRRVVCGGTTSNIVAEQVGDAVHTDLTTTRDDLPPAGTLSGVDLVTEGILTLARALELLEAAQGDPARLPLDRNAGVLLAREFLEADAIEFLCGQSVNPTYQNPQLPRSISIRRSLVTQLAELLRRFHKETRIEWV